MKHTFKTFMIILYVFMGATLAGGIVLLGIVFGMYIYSLYNNTLNQLAVIFLLFPVIASIVITLLMHFSVLYGKLLKYIERF